MKTEYRYQVGEVVNESLEIVSQTRSATGKNRTQKSYEVRSTIYKDAPTYIVSEGSLKRGSGCSYKAGHRIYEGNSLYSIERVRPYLVDIEEAKKIRPQYNTKCKFRCPICDVEKYMKPSNLLRGDFYCPKCSNHTSYPELFMMAYLELKGIQYEYQKTYTDLPGKRFDFYTPCFGLLETHGLQHYKEIPLWDYNSIVESDRVKENYCLDNSIPYLVIDSRESNFNFMVRSINNSILPSISENEYSYILNFMEKNKRYPVKKLIYLYENLRSVYKVGEVLSIPHSTVYTILKRHNITLYDKRIKQIVCTTTGEIFNTQKEASKVYNIDRTNLNCALKGRRKSAGKHPITGEKLTWEYVDNE